MGHCFIPAEMVAELDRLSALPEDEYWSQYFVRKAERPPLKPLGKPCHDCAVVWGFYTDISNRLAEQPADIRKACSLNWYCHNNPSRACRGNIDNIASLIHPIQAAGGKG